MATAVATERRIVIEYDPYPDYSYIETDEEAFNAADIRATKLYLETRRPELRQHNGARFELATRRVQNAEHGYWGKTPLRVGQYYVIELADGERPLGMGIEAWRARGARRLALPSEVIMTWDDWEDTHGDLDNYVSLYAKEQVRCACCGEWSDDTEERIGYNGDGSRFTYRGNDVGGIDFYEGPGATEYAPSPGAYSLDELRAMPGGRTVIEALGLTN